MEKKIKAALITVFHKEGLEKIVRKLDEMHVRIYSTGGTQKFVSELGISVTPVEDITSYPSILGGRVKTLHPRIFGGILARREHSGDRQEMKEYEIPPIDLVVVDLYPFEETVKSGADEASVIEKIDIGGISLIRAAAKNFKDVLVISRKNQYPDLLGILENRQGITTLEERRHFATQAFEMSSHYDTQIFNWFNRDENIPSFKQSIFSGNKLRYGENPHQQAYFYGDFEAWFDQIHGKEISYNNLLDIDAAEGLIVEFSDTAFAVFKHNNACGVAIRSNLFEAWKDALAGDPVSAFGGILATNRVVDDETAADINKLFFEVIMAPGYTPQALEVLKTKKKRIILKRKKAAFPAQVFRTALNGVLVQDRDNKTETHGDLKAVTHRKPTAAEVEDLLFANILVKHSKSNAIVLVKDKQLLGHGIGQTSRIDALKQAVEKAKRFGFDLQGAVMASDAFFPFPDSVQVAHEAGISAVIQPGGSIRDQESVDYCNDHEIAMVFTGIRHFKH
ncbi:MAG: bifunctional phosphoribosylaminoimidazolecarboxamide formyltransferase/IMP cyclohydrolase [Bacteroidales bacterium]|nr:bifunctional phosphoribosylaminoimidazolecarboxamide formyltransferase/IMP cyclohydrolase [Bacteroidales bacterium]